MKKYSSYIIILALGLLGGWLISNLGNGESQSHEHTQTSDQQWTCSMHPQILQPDAGACPICGMDLIPASSSADGLQTHEFKMTKNALALANVETSIVKSTTGNLGSLKVSGIIQENESANAVQSAHFSGRIEKLHINSIGEYVKKGQLLASIYAPELITAQKELLTAASLKSTENELYNAVRSKLKNWKLTDAQIANLETSKTVVSSFPIYSNVNGIVQELMVNEGNYVKEGQGLFTISNLATVWADFDVYEQQIGAVEVGDLITIRSTAYPGDSIKAKITFIDPVINERKRTTIVRATLRNDSNNLKPGMFVEGLLESSSASSEGSFKISIPKSAVMWTGLKSVVYVKKSDENPVFEMRKIVLGDAFDDSYVVLDGLVEGEEVVSNGTFTIDAAAQLQGKKSMMNQVKDVQQESSEKEVVRLNVSVDFQKQLANVYDHYILIKNALVKTDATKTASDSKPFLEQLEKVDMTLLENEAHGLWMADVKKMESAVIEMGKSDDVEVQRKHFNILSNHLISSIESFGINKKIYKQFCPMANNDNGGFWLSNNEEIRNPYFGDIMLQCGNVTSIIE